MCNYHLQILITIKLFLMGEMLMQKQIYAPIPPIEKGVNSVAESLTKEIYDCIAQNVSGNPVLHIEDLQLEVLMERESINAHYKKQLVEKSEVYFSNLPNFGDRVKYCMVMVERELTDKLTFISKHLYE